MYVNIQLLRESQVGQAFSSRLWLRVQPQRTWQCGCFWVSFKIHMHCASFWNSRIYISLRVCQSAVSVWIFSQLEACIHICTPLVGHHYLLLALLLGVHILLIFSLIILLSFFSHVALFPRLFQDFHSDAVAESLVWVVAGWIMHIAHFNGTNSQPTSPYLDWQEVHLSQPYAEMQELHALNRWRLIFENLFFFVFQD